MAAKTSVNDRCVCKSAHKPKKQAHKLPVLLGLLIAILPKCPFCLFGYSTVLTMCSGDTIHQYSPNSLNWLPILLAVLLIASLVWNFQGKLSYYALFISLLGATFVAYSEIYSGNESVYYIGVFTLFISVLINGRFRYVLKRFTPKHTERPLS